MTSNLIVAFGGILVIAAVLFIVGLMAIDASSPHTKRDQ